LTFIKIYVTIQSSNERGESGKAMQKILKHGAFILSVAAFLAAVIK